MGIGNRNYGKIVVLVDIGDLEMLVRNYTNAWERGMEMGNYGNKHTNVVQICKVLISNAISFLYTERK